MVIKQVLPLWPLDVNTFVAPWKPWAFNRHIFIECDNLLNLYEHQKVFLWQTACQVSQNQVCYNGLLESFCLISFFPGMSLLGLSCHDRPKRLLLTLFRSNYHYVFKLHPLLKISKSIMEILPFLSIFGPSPEFQGKWGRCGLWSRDPPQSSIERTRPISSPRSSRTTQAAAADAASVLC